MSYTIYSSSSSPSSLYQIRCSLKVSPGKLPITIEACIPDQSNGNNNNNNGGSNTSSPAGATTASPTGPCIVNGAGTSKVFQILYRNEEVSLRDVIMFRAHLLGE
jgi:hypothetical protein